MKRLFVLSGLLAALTVSAGQHDGSGIPEPIRIAVVSGDHHADVMGGFEMTRKAMLNRFGEGEVLFIDGVRPSELMKMIESRSIDFFIATSGISRQALAAGTRELLTAATPRFPNPNRAYGTVFLVRRNSPIQTFAEMKGSRLVTNNPYSTYGYQIGMAELERRGFAYEDFFKSETFLRLSYREVVSRLLKGDFDVASVPSCMLEDSYAPDSPERTELRAVAPLRTSPCLLSTEQYPNWTLSAVAGTDPDMTRELVLTLLGIDRSSPGGWWSFATDYVGTDRAFRTLRVGVYDVLKERSLEDFLNKYGWVAAVTGVLILLGFTMSAVLKHLVRKRTEELRGALRKQIEARCEADAAEERYRNLERVGLIGQLSALFAHEIRQPIGAISAYANGLLNCLETDTLTGEVAESVVRKIAAQAARAESIVEKVRGYAKRDADSRRDDDIGRIVLKTVSLFVNARRFDGEIVTDVPEGLIGFVDPFELQIAVLNLLKNASEALGSECARAAGEPMICVTLVRRDGFADIVVEDNGRPISEDELAAMKGPLLTGKPSGLGIGLVLVRSIALRQNGRFTFSARPEGGLRAVIELPLKEKK